MYYEYLIADKTKFPQISSPTQDHNVPIYLGLGVKVPISTFMHRRKSFMVERVIPVGDSLNPFQQPLVMAVRI